MFKISVGSSTIADTAEATGATIAQCLSRLGQNEANAAIVFNSGHDQDAAILRAITETWPDIPLIGSACRSETGERRLTLMLLASPDLDFRVGLAPQVRQNPEFAAENALAGAAEGDMDLINLCLSLPDSSADWSQQFSERLRRLLPPGASCLNDLLPFDDQPSQSEIDRHYVGRRVLHDAAPILLALRSTQKLGNPGWSLTRQQGVLRKVCGDHVYEYDNFLSDRRRPSRTS